MTTQTFVRDLFQTAYEGRYTWDNNFPGYSADVKVVYDLGVCTGKISIQPDFCVEVSEVANEDVKLGIYTQLQDLITHRKQQNFEEVHGKHEFVLGETDNTGAVEIFLKSDSMDSQYKIRDRKIYQVSRVMGRKAFVINTHASLDTGSGYLTTRYDAIERNTQTSEVECVIEFEDTYEKFGNYYIMTKQVVQEEKDGDRTVTEFNYLNIELL
ncbi:MAG: DUF3386 domain-containing protein [Calothrix sp. SM1_7_51]|nr:DUF3386 domain-containing protein [Calothrix sp. SM1_7_51]